MTTNKTNDLTQMRMTGAMGTDQINQVGEMNNADEFAFPSDSAITNAGNIYGSGGLTKLEHFAGLAMQGLIVAHGGQINRHRISVMAWEQAQDMFLCKENLDNPTTPTQPVEE